MTPTLQTDSAVLSTEASSFMSISAELKGVMGTVDDTAAGLAASWEGLAATAAQEALVRYREAAEAQKLVLDDIAENIQTGGVKYDTADTDGASMIGTTEFPNLGINA